MVKKKKNIKKNENIKEINKPKNSRIEKNKKQRFDVAKKEHIENTVNIGKVIFKIILILFLIFGSIYITCRYIGTSGLVVKEYSIDYDNLPDSFYGLKIIHVSDINYNSKTMPMKKVKKVVEQINILKPDLILFTGNLVYGDITQEELKELNSVISNLDASIGKYAVFGEDNSDIKILMKNAGFIDIEDSYDLVYGYDNEPILINGLSNNLNLDKAFEYFANADVDSNIFTITLTHKPDNIKEVLKSYDINIAFAGHSLNGLINIPGVGGIVKLEGSQTYINSYYKERNTDIYISSGVGTREYPYRLFNHPSISLFRLK